MMLVNGKELASILKISRGTLKYMRDAGMPYIRLNARTILYREEKVQAWLIEQESKAEETALKDREKIIEKNKELIKDNSELKRRYRTVSNTNDELIEENKILQKKLVEVQNKGLKHTISAVLKQNKLYKDELIQVVRDIKYIASLSCFDLVHRGHLKEINDERESILKICNSVLKKSGV